VQTDSRKVRSGELFFALRGENFDGNRYASSALEKGALAAVVDNPEVATDDRYLLVDDVLGALQRLAHHHRMQFSIPVLAITGTNGKTTTKELTSAVIAKGFRLLRT
jgi:UDP-N-acetylmuramoyl-tripeptide--D-alanyl-D-alanine ligase